MRLWSFLHKACLRMHGLAKKSTTLMNYYAPLFFLEVSSVEPVKDFVRKLSSVWFHPCLKSETSVIFAIELL
ncbi:hypothetical protein SOVF_050090 [Spinacia oleracea]|nr:hypothetical protein SOVF_050090 [Spinacia oleracea]